ncbi:hypothetical protein AB0H86_01440 [Streptomyces sp. NPDC050997]|uniref:hypothetical protein n=1 Tax=Streptomyces sp. NPDC050997 TaxID=3155519 RepID=UPI00343110B0
MKQRGRHRRRKRGRAFRAFLAGTALALTGAATMISASQATVDGNPGALKPLSSATDTAALGLQAKQVPQRSLDRLASAMGRPVGVGAVLDNAVDSLRDPDSCTGEERAALPVEPAATRAYCWTGADAGSWRAGAVTTSGDADDDGVWGQNRVILSGWTQDTGTDGRDLARVAFVDANDLRHLRYTSVLLVVPVDGGRDYRALGSRLSGMVWYQDKLLVTADDEGRDALYVYDMNRVQRTTVDAKAVGRVRDGWSAHGYQYVLPAVGSYRLTGGDSAARPESISLDRTTTPDSLVASSRPADDGDRPTLLWRYSFSTASTQTSWSGLLATDTTGRTGPTEAYRTEGSDVGGVLSYHDNWFVARAGSGDGHGTLWRQTEDGAQATRCGSEERRNCWSPDTPSLSYWEESGEVWTQSERMLFALPLASMDRALE